MKYTLIILASLIFSCEKEAVRSKHAEGVLSFSHEKWEFEEVFFSKMNEEIMNIPLIHYNDTSSIIDKILFFNIPIIMDTIKLNFLEPGTQSDPKIATAFYFINIGDDAQGEHYVIDSTKSDSYILLDCISKNRITGTFRINFIISNDTVLPKSAPYIPDSFFIEEGQFNAKRY